MVVVLARLSLAVVTQVEQNTLSPLLQHSYIAVNSETLISLLGKTGLSEANVPCNLEMFDTL